MNWFKVSETRWIFGTSISVPCAAEIVQNDTTFTATLTHPHMPGEELGIFPSLASAQAAVEGRP